MATYRRAGLLDPMAGATATQQPLKKATQLGEPSRFGVGLGNPRRKHDSGSMHAISACSCTANTPRELQAEPEDLRLFDQPQPHQRLIRVHAIPQAQAASQQHGQQPAPRIPPQRHHLHTPPKPARHLA